MGALALGSQRRLLQLGPLGLGLESQVPKALQVLAAGMDWACVVALSQDRLEDKSRHGAGMLSS